MLTRGAPLDRTLAALSGEDSGGGRDPSLGNGVAVTREHEGNRNPGMSHMMVRTHPEAGIGAAISEGAACAK